MCSDTASDETGYPASKSWSPMPGTYSTSSSRYACVPINVTCNCSGRNQVCSNTTTGTSSTITNHSSCQMQGYCSTSYQDINAGTVTFGATYALGSVTYVPAQNTVTVPYISLGGQRVGKQIIDSYDGKSIYLSCDLEYNGGYTFGNTGYPRIMKFYASPSVVKEGDTCRFGWETNNMETCTIDSVSVPTGISAADLGAYTASTTEDKNLVKRLTCVGKVTGGTAPIVSTTTTCYVNPRVREN
jgi:hypothetical protein